MQFEMWGFWHYLYIASPFIILTLLYLLLKNKSQKTKYIVGVIIGVISLAILTTRNVDIVMRNGFDPQAIPLQVCHFGNIMVFLALIFKNKTLGAIAFCLNLPYAFSSLVMADTLAGYSPITWTHIRAQAYIWGHLFIVIGAVYPVMLGIIKFKLKHMLKGMLVVAIMFVVGMLMNLLLNGLGWGINYFYAFDSGGVPFGFMENLAPKLNIMFKNNSTLFVAWDWLYSTLIFVLGIISFFIMYGFSKVVYNLKGAKQN